MNRHERRAARTRGVIFVDYGHLLQCEGLPVECYACGAAHKASAIARIHHQQSTTIVPLCEVCFETSSDIVVRKYLNLEISEGGEATTEQILAVAERQQATDH